MASDPDTPFTLAFVGYADPSMSARATAYEDAVLPLLEDYGAKILYRGRRAGGQDDTLPLEIHLLWFPDRRAMEGVLADDRRQALLQEFGDVFTRKHAVELDTIAGVVRP